MSLIGKKPISIPDKVKIKIESGRVFVEGPKGKLDWALPPFVEVKIRRSGNFCIDTCFGNVDGISHKYCKNLQHSDGYLYSAKELTKGAAFPPIPKGTGFHAVV